MRATLSYIIFLSLLFKYSILSSSLPSSSCSYQDAKEIRVKYGHTAALPLYQKLLETYGDVTAATRIAASPCSMIRHDMACPLPRGADEYHLNAWLSNKRKEEERHDKNQEDDDEIMIAIQKLRAVLKQSGYFCHEKIQRLFGVMESLSFSSLFDCKDAWTNPKTTMKKEWSKVEALGFAQGPVYVSPISAGRISQLPPFIIDEIENDDPKGSSLRCLVAMFLLGFAVPRKVLLKHLVGGEETIELLQLLGLAFPCEMDASMIVPYVHIFPLQVQYLKNNHHHSGKGQDSQQTATAKATSTATDTMILVTDLHPTILSRTTVGQKEDGAVMYIGSDSLALVQHLPTRLHVENVFRQKYQCCNTNDKEKEKLLPFQILDLCTGSGVQALYMLMSMRFLDPTAKAVCVDVNDRALRFVRFNALLNGIERDRVWTLKADLVSGLCLEEFAREEEEQSLSSSSPGGHGNVNIIDMLLHGAWHKQKPGNFGYNNIPQGPFDLILANPPFIPTPSYCNDNESSCIPEDISKRYGLFSSGGSSGEEVLRSVISMSSRLIKKEHGLLAIVAEFMNPPTNDSGTDIAVTNRQDSLQKQQCQFLYKLCDWWERSPSRLSLLPSSDTSVDETCADIDAVAAARGLLFTNEAPMSPQKYAARRANDEKEYSAWLRNLQRHDIELISPGLLYIETALRQTTMTTKPASSTSTQSILDLDYRLVPKCQELGSIWTPYNYKALLYTWCEWSAWRSAYSWDNPS